MPGSSSQVGPRFFPYLVGGVVVAIGVAARDPGRGAVTRARPTSSEDVDPDAGTDWRAVGIIVVAFLAHALLINVARLAAGGHADVRRRRLGAGRRAASSGR